MRKPTKGTLCVVPVVSSIDSGFNEGASWEGQGKKEVRKEERHDRSRSQALHDDGCDENDYKQ